MYSFYAQHCDETPIQEKSSSDNSTIDLKLSDGMTLCLRLFVWILFSPPPVFWYKIPGPDYEIAQPRVPTE